MAPQIIFIYGDAYIYYAVGNTDNDDCDHFYISKANDDFTAITSFQMLYGANEASSVFRRINDDTWNVGNVNYSSDIGFHFHTADAMLRNLQSADDMTGHLSPQHGSFVYVTQTEYEILHATLQSDVTHLGARLRLSQALYRAKKRHFTGIEGHESALDNELNGGALTQAIADAQASSETSDATLWDTQADALNEATTTIFKAVKAAGKEEEGGNGDFSNGDKPLDCRRQPHRIKRRSPILRLPRNRLHRIPQTNTAQPRTRLLPRLLPSLRTQWRQRPLRPRLPTRRRTHQPHIHLRRRHRENPITLISARRKQQRPLRLRPHHVGRLNPLLSLRRPLRHPHHINIEGDHSRASIGLERIKSTVTSSDWCCFDPIKHYKKDDPTTSVTSVKKRHHSNSPRPRL